MAQVVYLVSDLLFVSKIRETANSLGLSVERAESGAALPALARGASLVLIDLRRPDALAALGALAADPATAKISKAGFIDHERVDVMDAAREHGCRALAKGAFTKELPQMMSPLA